MYSKRDGWVVGALALGAALARVPYLTLIPVFGDEVEQTVLALNINPARYLPLVGYDPYTGPFFSYLIVVCLRVFGSTPAAPRVVVMILGALTVVPTYVLARELGLGRPWAALTGLMLIANPYHILNSHYAGATFTVPFFSTAFLAATAISVRRESGLWLVVAGALLGLALQANPIPLLMLPGVAIWFLVQRKAKIGLRTRWPYLALAVFVLFYAPVILYNVRSGLFGAKVAMRDRYYLWQDNPSWPIYIRNLGRLTLQVGRQIGGVLIEGHESFKTLWGLPAVLGVWAVAGWVYAIRGHFSLIALAVGSQMLIMPWFSNYYGDILSTRFTDQLTPLILVGMSGLAAGAWAWMRHRAQHPPLARTTAWFAAALLVALSLWPLVSLFRYYDRAVSLGDTNARHYAFFDEFIRQWRGEKILVSTSDKFIMVSPPSRENPLPKIWSNPFEYMLAVNRVPYTLLSLEDILGRLMAGEETGRVFLVLSSDEVPRAKAQADLVAWHSAATETGRELDYGVYTISDAQQVHKPAFVLTDVARLPSTVNTVQINFADRLGIVGYESEPSKAASGAQLVVQVYWKALSAMSDDYTGFLHLMGPNGQLAAQVDRQLGGGVYSTDYWQPGDIIAEKYTLTLPDGSPAGDYTLQIGAYAFPSMERLVVRSASVPAQDNVVELGTLRVEP